MVKILSGLSLGPDAREQDSHGTKFFPCAIYKTCLHKQIGRRIPEHWHGEIEIGFVEKGKIAFSCDHKEYILYEDDVYFIKPSFRHSMKDMSENSIFYSIVFHEDMITGPGSINEKYINPVIHNRDHPFQLIQDAYILTTLKNIVSLGDEQIIGYELLIRNHLSSIILWLCRRYQVREDIPKPSEISTKVEKMLTFMADHYMEDIQVKQIADYAYISVRECYRAFRSELDSSPTDYLHQYRMKKAADLLVSTDLKIEAIAKRCGYNQPGYFATRFKGVYDCSPSEYRKLNRQDSP
ncbi:MAG: AraC family transcriptional regulator [Lachnospiraceae bacterium]|nr:AraC family transcriptional regulator [Lachnospiraceae bacterium]